MSQIKKRTSSHSSQFTAKAAQQNYSLSRKNLTTSQICLLVDKTATHVKMITKAKRNLPTSLRLLSFKSKNQQD